MKEKGNAVSRSHTDDGKYCINPGLKVRKKSPYCKSSAVKMLEQLADNAARAKYPTVPFLAPRKFRDDSANGLTKCILSFLRIMGHQAERVSSSGRLVDTRKTFCDVIGCRRTIGTATWIKGNGTLGTADISATICGMSVKIEVKIGKDRQSPYQKAYQQAVLTAGGKYVIARDFQEFYDWYNLNFGGSDHEE